MSFANLWALWALLAVPIVVALHWFRRRLPARRVAGLFLFLGAEPVPPEGRSRDRLRWTLPLLLESLVAAGVALWLAGPVFGDWARPMHLLLVLDDSASMTAPGVGGRAAADQVRDDVLRRTEVLAAETVVTVVLAGDSPRVLLGPRAPLALLEDALAAYAPAAISADLGAAVALADALADGQADDVAAGGERTQRVLFGDRPVGAAWPRWEAQSVGVAGPNFALEDVQLVGDGDGARVMVAVRSYSDRAPAFEVLVDPSEDAGGARGSLGRTSLQVEPGELASAEIELAVRPQGAIDVALSAGSDDGLAIDDRARVVVEPEREVVMAWVGTAVGAERVRWPRLVRALDAVAQGDRTRADLVATDESVDGLDVAVVVRVGPTEGELRRVRGPFLRDRSSALLDGVVFEGVDWFCGEATPPGAPLLLDGRRVLASVEERGPRLVVHLNLEAASGSIVEHPAWPALWSNLAEAARARLAGPLRANLRSGEAMAWRLDLRADGDRGASFRMLDGAGAELAQAGLRTLRWDARRPGLHRLLRDGREVARYAVHFHAPGESDLSVRAADARPAEIPAPEDLDEVADGAVGVGRGERALLAWLVLAALVADWWVLGRARARRALS